MWFTPWKEIEVTPPPVTEPVPSPLTVQSDALAPLATAREAPVKAIGTVIAPPVTSMLSALPVTSRLLTLAAEWFVVVPSTVTATPAAVPAIWIALPLPITTSLGGGGEVVPADVEGGVPVELVVVVEPLAAAAAACESEAAALLGAGA